MIRNRIDQTFSHLRRRRRKALIGYVTAGYPSKKSFMSLVPRLEAAGLDLLEVGVPFSDPIADGPTIQHASQVTLQQGVTLRWILQAVTALRRTVQLPIVLMSYVNPLLAMGLKAFFSGAHKAGVDGLIVPDLIPEEAAGFEALAGSHHVHLIYLAAPTTPATRLSRLAHRTQGFLYAVSLTGVTGARASFPQQTHDFLRRLRPLTAKPLAVGFGLSNAKQMRTVRPYVDGVIVGSALIQAIAGAPRPPFAKATRFVTALQHALNDREQVH